MCLCVAQINGKDVYTLNGCSKQGELETDVGDCYVDGYIQFAVQFDTVQADSSPYNTCARDSRQCSLLNNSTILCFPVHMTVMSKRPISRSANSPASSSNSRARRCTTVQARPPLWLSTCTGPACSTLSRLRSPAWPLITGLPPTSAIPRPACKLPTFCSTAAPRQSLLHWTQSRVSLAGLTKSACITPALHRALTGDCFFLSGCSHFWRRREKRW